MFAQFVPVASFASSILFSKDHPSLVIGALQMVDLLLAKVPALYKPAFRREGVFNEVEVLAERPITSAKSKDKESPEASASESGSAPPAPPISVASIPGFKKLYCSNPKILSLCVLE
jgi:E3 ubiquitin-protein ligase TRIP12